VLPIAAAAGSPAKYSSTPRAVSQRSVSVANWRCRMIIRFGQWLRRSPKAPAVDFPVLFVAIAWAGIFLIRSFQLVWSLLSLCCGRSLITAVVLASGLVVAEAASNTSANPIADVLVETAPASLFDFFLDRLMAAESGGRNDAKNPRSTALGPFQLLRGTFLDVTRRHFRAEIAGLTEEEIAALRTEPGLSRRVAAAYCKEIVRYLKKQGLAPTFAYLRLAYLLGPADAARIIQAQAETPVVSLLSLEVIAANPFMRHMSVAELVAKSKRDLARDANDPYQHHEKSYPVQPQVAQAPCNLKLAPCRKYMALAIARASKNLSVSRR
jgi:hypothetical protein